MIHWAAKYIGFLHQEGGRGPDAFDCWGLLWYIYEHEFGIHLPSLPGVSSNSVLDVHSMLREASETEWDSVEVPFDGCGVAMSQKTAFHHVGVYIGADGGKVLHCWKGHNTIADTLSGLRLKGFRTVAFYRHQLWLTSLRPQTLLSL